MVLHVAITGRILGAALKVHTALGAGCLESTYDACLRHQLEKDGLKFRHIVEECVILELKAVEKLLPLHLAQVLTYLKLSRFQLGLIINFNVPHLRDGIRRVIRD